MINLDNIQNETIIICEKETKKQILKQLTKEQKLLNIKILTKKELIKKLYFSYDLNAILYLIEKYNYKYEVATMYLDNLIYIEDKTYKNDKLTPIKVIGLVVGFIGLIISQLTGGVHLSDMFSFSLTGEGFMLIYGLLAALATMLAKRIGSTLNSFVMTGWNLIIGSLGLYIIGFIMGGRLSAINWTVTGGALLMILAAASAIPFSLWYWAAQYGNLGEITVYKFIMPISGSILAVLLGESVTVSLMVGLALVCLSIILINRPSKFEEIKEIKESLRKVDQV